MTPDEATVVREVVEQELEGFKASVTETIRKEIAATAVPAAIQSPHIEMGSPKNQLGTIMKAIGMASLNMNRKFADKLDTVEDAFNLMGKDINMYVPQVLRKDLSASVLASGGALVMPMFSQEIIPALTANTVMRKAGCPVIDMPNGNLTVSGFDTIGDAYWHGETKAKTKSDPTTSQLRMTAKKLGKELAISNDLIKYGMANTEAQIQNSIVLSVAIAEDAAYLEGTGTSYAPKGIKSWMTSTQAVATTGTTLAQIKADLIACKNRLDKANVIEMNRVWIMHPSVKNFILGQETTTGLGTIWANELLTTGKLFGYPVYTTTQLSGTAAAAPVYLVDLEYCLIGQGRPLELRFTPYGTYLDSSGNTQSGSSTDMSVFTALIEVDFILKKGLAAASITGTSWVY